MKESKNLEFKSTVASSYLKTVSAYANYSRGKILFGVDDEGEPIGLKDPKKDCLSIENQINDNIRPVPLYRLNVDSEHGTVTLEVEEGPFKPYLYKNKAFKRADTSTIEVDRIEFNRLVLLGANKQFEELPARQKQLHFDSLESAMVDALDIKGITRDILKTLKLFSEENGYNNAAVLLSSENDFPGIDIATFGENLDIFLDRKQFEAMSILDQFFRTLEYLSDHYSYEQISGGKRIRIERIPVKAIREVIANALVHRAWDIRASIRASLYPDRVEITSPGGLPNGISEEEYLNGQISLPRNPLIASIFYRLGIIEQFGTGVLRIKAAYDTSYVKPGFRIYANSITVILPLTETLDAFDEEERRIFLALQEQGELSRADMEVKLDINKSKAIRILNALMEKNAIERFGSGKNVVYRLL